MMLRRREFLAMAAGAPALASVPARRVKVETVFRSPGPQPNGLQATAEGLWILDQRDNRAYLVRYSDGKVLRALDTESDRGSGITFDGQAIWIASTYNCKLLRADARTGKSLAVYDTPGRGPVRWTTSRPSPLAPKRESAAAAKPQAPQPPRQDTGAHGLEWKDGRLWAAVPPAQTIYRIDPRGFRVEQHFPTAGDRPHGLGWEGDWLWCTESNDNAFYKFDTQSGQYAEKIQLSDADPLPHGMSIWQGTVWYCDDVGVVCRFKLR